MASGSIAIARGFKGKSEQDTDFFNYKAFGKTAETMETYLGKGSQVGLCGEVRADNYTNKDGNKAVYTYILVNNFYFVGSKNDNAKSTSNTDVGLKEIQDNLDKEDLPF